MKTYRAGAASQVDKGCGTYVRANSPEEAIETLKKKNDAVCEFNWGPNSPLNLWDVIEAHEGFKAVEAPNFRW